MIVVDHSEYASGPAWWPLIVVLPAVGGLIGMATGFAVTAATRRTSEMRSRLAIGAGFVVTGGLIGWATALIGAAVPPRQTWADVLEPADTYVDPMSALYLPPHLDLEPIWVSFPALGIAASLLAAAAIVFRPGPRFLRSR